MSASAIEQPSTSETWSIRSNSTRQSVYDACGHLQVAGRPGRQPAQGERGAAGEVVVLQRDVERAPGVRRPCRRRPRARGPARRDGRRSRPAAGGTRPGPRRPCRSRPRCALGGVQPALGVVQQLLDPLERCRSTSAPRPGCCTRTGRTRSTSAGRLSSQAAQRRLSSVPAQGGHLQLHQVGRAPEVAAGHRVPDRLGPVAVLLRTTRWPAGAARRRGPAARRGAGPAGRRRTGGGSGTTGGGRPAGPGTGCPGRGPPARARPPSCPVRASHREPFIRSRTEVCSRNAWTSSGWRCRTSSTR